MKKPIISHEAFYARTKGAYILLPLFAKWHDVLSKATIWLGRCRYPDHPYWYGERSHIGWLALAAYKKGWLPLQEPGVLRKGKRFGRSDLWIYTGRAAKTKVYDFEAKDADLNLSSLKNPETFYKNGYIRANLRKAIKQVNDKPNSYKGNVGIAVVFIVLYVSKGASKAAQVVAVTDFKKAATSHKVLKKAGADFMALFLAPYSRIKALSKSYGPHLGVAVLGKRVW